MSRQLLNSDDSPDAGRRSSVALYAARGLAFCSLIYALLAGLHTLQDFDLGWQLATGRWVLHHHHVFSADVFSYTACGQPWIYPVLSGLIFYLCFLAGGYALLAWLGAFACAGTVALLFKKDNLAVAALSLVAVPLIANRTQPRAEMFTAILFAAFLALLWRHHRGEKSRLWLLPLLMILWVNLHPGFVAGLALCGAYVLLEVLDLPFAENRHAAVDRIRQAWLWLVLTAVATLVNPWGPFVYRALLRQESAQSFHNLWIVEWESIRPSIAGMHQAIDWRDPQSAFWWLMTLALVSVCVALWRRHVGAAGLLLASAYLAFQHVRLQALFASVVVTIGGSLLDEAGRAAIKALNAKPRVAWNIRRMTTLGAALVLFVLVTLAGIRSWDLVSNRYYMRSAQLSLFGSGLSWWFPAGAADFLEREKLPANVFSTYALGGYMDWRLFPSYRDYIDSRAVPFGPQLFFRAYDLSVEPPDSPVWKEEADARGINTIIVPLSRYQGMTLFPQLHAFCRSQSWSPVYLDEVSAIFVRRTPATAALIQRLQIDCDKTSFDPPSGVTAATTRTRAELFNAWANAGGVLYSLERYPEALAYLDRAQSAFPDNANVHMLRALVYQQLGSASEAEADFRASLSLEPSDEAWFDLGLFYMTQARYPDAAELFKQSAEVASRPHEMWMMLGQAYLRMQQPQPALEAFDKAEAASPFRDGGEALGSGFNSLIATGRAKASYQLGDVAQAVTFQEEAVRLAPGDAKLWLGLADLYEAQGRTTKAAEARAHAQGR